MGAHTTSDDPTRYRLEADLESWKLKDPLERLKAFLYRQQIADRGWFDGARRRRPTRWPRGCVTECLSLPDPDPLDMFEHVYAEQTEPLLAEQRGVRRLPGRAFEAS